MSEKNLKIRNYEYKYLLWLSIIFQFSLIIFLTSTPLGDIDRIVLVYFFVCVFIVGLFAYIFICLIFFIFMIDIFYYILLKKIFPEEEIGETEKSVSISNLSSLINLSDQKLYLNTAIINFIVYLLVVVYVFLGIMSLVPSQDDIIKVIVEFSKKNSIASFGNTLGIVSLTIAIYTATYTVQNKIYDQALKKFEVIEREE